MRRTCRPDQPDRHRRALICYFANHKAQNFTARFGFRGRIYTSPFSFTSSVADFRLITRLQIFAVFRRLRAIAAKAFGVMDFKGAQFSNSVIMSAVFFYVRYAVSYRDFEEITAERGVRVDHVNLNRWLVKYGPLIAAKAQACKRKTASFWRVDETYIKAKGR